MLDRDKILGMTAGNGLKPKAITLSEIDESVYVARLTAGQVDRYQEEIKKADKSLVRGTILKWALVDWENKRLFNSDDDAIALSRMPADTAEVIVDAFMELNGLGNRKN